MPTAIALRHVHFEDLGIIEPVLGTAGYGVEYLDVADDPSRIAALDPDLLIVLGAPVGALDDDIHPWLAEERELLRHRLAVDAPTLGICLGAQLMAVAAGGALTSGEASEIGYAPIELTDQGRSSVLRHLDGVPVLHWHGDRFTTPSRAVRLARTETADQAFSIGPRILGLQFHVEAEPSHIERWLIGHAHELAAHDVSPVQIRQDAERYSTRLGSAARQMIQEWVSGL
ncbi:MAG: glutamine amidotransferase [Acidipropionibacterium jensenii]|uniref:glutamine amidotransferase n=1 Tax=Acidipropionibacterium jensenii TaxID=1749 RepID=UPI002649F332|nr:glutamine amidotransferase [Acidipropionibacterium jensenii]MDN6442215.1 glutamine amidotransferase [Acidipropionibacterium jensenii]